MAQVFVIAECGSNWRFGDKTKYHIANDAMVTPDELMNAYRMIRAAKECGADAAKFQWVSDYRELMKRRGEKDDEETRRVYGYVHFPAYWLSLLKAECDRVGVQFGCTAFLAQDVVVVSPFVDFIKIAARESADKTLREEWKVHRGERRMFVSLRKDENGCYADEEVERLHCVSKYPTALEELCLDEGAIPPNAWVRDGLSEHSAHVLTGAVAVGVGFRVIESHVRLHDTPESCPDYGHSLVMHDNGETVNRHESYWLYVHNIRAASRMM